MAEAHWAKIITALRKKGIPFAPGLSDLEVQTTESRYGFQFPPDLRDFLQAGLPTGKGFPNWRTSAEAELRDWLDLPREGILFDIEHNNFWLDEWGPRPTSLTEAKQIASNLITKAPKLIPVYIHRMLPSEPHLPGNPVFSVHQTDIIYYGFDLTDYLRHEFKLPDREPWPTDIRQIRFWDLDHFQNTRWGPDGNCEMNNSQPP